MTNLSTMTLNRAIGACRSFDPAHGCIHKLGQINVGLGKHLESLPDAFDRGGHITRRERNRNLAVRIEGTTLDPRFDPLRGDIEDTGVGMELDERCGFLALAGDED